MIAGMIVGMIVVAIKIQFIIYSCNEELFIP